MSWAKATKDGIERWFTTKPTPDQESWSERIRGWMVASVVKGAKTFLEAEEPDAIDNAADLMAKVKANPKTPPEVIAMLTRVEEGKSWFMLLLAIPFGLMMLWQLIQGIWLPASKQVSYQEERTAQTFRFDPMSVITAWRRDKVTYEEYFDDLRDMGWSDERIEALKFFTLFMPGATDIVSWYAREVYEPDMIERYGLDSELPNYETTDFPKIGVDSTQAKNFWRAHWEHASYMQIREMLRRGLLSLDKTMPTPPTTEAGWATRDAEGEKAAYDWYRLVEIPPFWRTRLTEMMYEVPTRVDVRRFWDMRTIDEERLRSIYHAQGYHGKDLDDYILWTKVYVAFPDLIARWRNGWISLEEVKTELTGLGMPAARVDEFIETKIKAAQPERTAKERDVTKTDIYKGVKQGVILRGEAIELLMDLGFEEDEAIYLLEINIPPDEEEVVIRERLLGKADIKAGIAKEVLTRAEARLKLLELRYRPADVEFLLDIYEVVAKPPPEPRVREASKADIVLGVKKGLITQEEGYGMLLELDFTPAAAEFILMVKTEESPFSPINFAEFKDLTSKYKRATGKEEKPMPEELKKAADEVVRVTDEVKALEESIVEEERGLIPGEALPEEATARLEDLQVARNRAIAEKERVKSEYDRLVAEWRHGLP